VLLAPLRTDRHIKTGSLYLTEKKQLEELERNLSKRETSQGSLDGHPKVCTTVGL